MNVEQVEIIMWILKVAFAYNCHHVNNWFWYLQQIGKHGGLEANLPAQNKTSLDRPVCDCGAAKWLPFHS